ncbi:MAG: hypothetical protein WC872_03945 [Candidatus Absconditabacterales bacterium]|jgi:hypothetical protein
MKKLTIFLCISFLIIVFACDKNNEEDQQKTETRNCPCSDDIVSWTNGGSYGKWKLLQKGNDGNSSDGNGCNLVSNCQWKVDAIQNGGYGNVYTTFPLDTSIAFTWKWNQLSVFTIYEKAGCITKEGIKMRATLTSFLKTYPYFKKDSINPSVYVYPGKPSVQAFFTDTAKNTGKLKKLIIAAQ